MAEVSPPSVMGFAEAARFGDWALKLPHRSDMDRVVWCTRGQGRALLDGERIGFGAQCAIYVPAGSLFCLDIGRNALGHILECDPTLLRFGDGPAIAGLARSSNANEQMALTQAFETIAREAAQKPPQWEEAMRLQARAVALWLVRHEFDHGTDDAARRLVRRFVDQFPRSPAATFSVKEAAARLNVSVQHLTTVCSRQTGFSALQLLNADLAHDVAVKLRKKQSSHIEIAQRAGFASASYFSRFVKKQCGASPSAIQK